MLSKTDKNGRPRTLCCAVVQMRGLSRDENKAGVIARMVDLLQQAHERGARFIAFPELALTTFFPRTWVENVSDLDQFFEAEMPNPLVAPLFQAARDRRVAFTFGYAELARESGRTRRFNTSIVVDAAGLLVGKYRKVHLPGHADNRSYLPFQHLEKRYFEVGDTGFRVWNVDGSAIGLCICNDRRWPETYRVLGLRGAEIVALGYNTPTQNTDWDEPEHLRMFHHLLSVQAGAYQNGLWVLAAAKAGCEDGFRLIGGSCIVAPTGEIAARTIGLGDEIIVHECDLSLCRRLRDSIFNFEAHRRIEHYRPITDPM